MSWVHTPSPLVLSPVHPYFPPHPHLCPCEPIPPQPLREAVPKCWETEPLIIIQFASVHLPPRSLWGCVCCWGSLGSSLGAPGPELLSGWDCLAPVARRDTSQRNSRKADPECKGTVVWGPSLALAWHDRESPSLWDFKGPLHLMEVFRNLRYCGQAPHAMSSLAKDRQGSARLAWEDRCFHTLLEPKNRASLAWSPKSGH